MPKFSYKVPPEYVGPNGIITLGGTSRLVQRAATDHSSSLGFTPKWYSKQNCGWVSRRSTLTIKHDIHQDQIVEVKTWIQDIRRVRSMRVYEVSTPHHSPAVRGWTDWIHIDRSQNKIKKIPQSVEKKLRSGESGEYEPDRTPINLEDPPKNAYDITQTVTFRDLDEQGHVNNTIYSDYIEETLMKYLNNQLLEHPENEPWNRIRIKSFTIKFLEELSWKQNFNCSIWKTGDRNFNLIMNDEVTSETIGEARGHWARRE